MNLRQAGAITIGTMGATGIAAAAGVVVAYRSWRRRAGGYSLRERTVLVTGGTRGLGFALAREFLAQGARLALCSRSQAECDSARAKLSGLGEVFTYVCDLRQPAEIDALATAIRQRFGFLDVLVNNAGVMQVGPWEQMTESEYAEALDVHLWAPLRLSRHFFPSMQGRGQGRIVNISSIGGLVPVPHMLPYTLSKFALSGFSEGLRAEAYRHGVRVTLICPWLTRTGSQENANFRGDYRREFAWFAASGSSPLVAQSPEHAARQIVAACRRGQARLVLGLPGKVAALLHGVAPGLATDLMAQVNRLLPAARPQPEPARSGGESYGRVAAKLLRPRIRRDQARYNQPAA
ncbi:MAG: SDR family NAD(P)-dependent oxidoreductase [Terriglobales bacterium]